MNEKVLTVKEMQEITEQLSYLPGWTLEVYEGFSEGPHFRAFGFVDDSVNIGEKVPLDIHSPIPPQLNSESFLLWIHWRLKRAWIHESMEWFKFKGKPIFDPHAYAADRDLYNPSIKII